MTERILISIENVLHLNNKGELCFGDILLTEKSFYYEILHKVNIGVVRSSEGIGILTGLAIGGALGGVLGAKYERDNRSTEEWLRINYNDLLNGKEKDYHTIKSFLSYITSFRLYNFGAPFNERKSDSIKANTEEWLMKNTIHEINLINKSLLIKCSEKKYYYEFVSRENLINAEKIISNWLKSDIENKYEYKYPEISISLNKLINEKLAKVNILEEDLLKDNELTDTLNKFIDLHIKEDIIKILINVKSIYPKLFNKLFDYTLDSYEKLKLSFESDIKKTKSILLFLPFVCLIIFIISLILGWDTMITVFSGIFTLLFLIMSISLSSEAKQKLDYASSAINDIQKLKN